MSMTGRVRQFVAGIIFLATLVVLLAAAAVAWAGAEAGAVSTAVDTKNSAALKPTSEEFCGQVISSPDPGTIHRRLLGVAAVSASDVWAVGFYGGWETTGYSLVEHWNGTQWSIVPSPSPGSSVSYLNAVAALSANDVWAVGSYWNLGSTFQPTLVEHWDGTSWSVVRTPNGDYYANQLNAVAALSPNDVWAVGFYVNNVGYQYTLALHWDGTEWMWYDGRDVDPGYFNNLLGVAAVSPNDVWAVGTYGQGLGGGQLLIIHWNGTEWSVIPDQDLGGDGQLNAVAALSANDVWAVGLGGVHGSPSGLIEHWDGIRWSIISPDPGYAAAFYSVAPVSANDVWAVGFLGGSVYDRTLAEHWNGTEWSVVPSPSPGSLSNYLLATAAVSANDVWAVGSYIDDATNEWTLVERFMPCSVLATPTPMVCAIQYTDVPYGSTYYDYIHSLACRGIVSGYADGTFRPYNNTTRGQLAKIAVLAEGWVIDTTGGPHFADVPQTNPFYPYIETAYHHQIISGYADGTFKWGNDVTRGQLAKIVVLAEGWAIDTHGGPHFSDVPQTDPFYGYIETALNHSIISGYSDGTFRPGNNATRGQVSKIIYLAITDP